MKKYIFGAVSLSLIVYFLFFHQFQWQQTRIALAESSALSAGADAVAASGTCTDNMAWTDPGLALNDNDSTFISYAAGNWDNTNVSDYIRATAFGFSITSSSIDGIAVEVLGWTTAGGANYHTVQLLDSGSALVGDNKATGALPTSDPSSTYQTFGSASDTWTSGVDEADIESANFGVQLCWTASADNTNANIDHVRITVTYTASAAQVIKHDIIWFN